MRRATGLLLLAATAALCPSAAAQETPHVTADAQELLDEFEFNPPWFWSGDRSRHMDASASVAAGLTYRSLVESIRDTHEWWQSQSQKRRKNARRWPTAEQERAVLASLQG